MAKIFQNALVLYEALKTVVPPIKTDEKVLLLLILVSSQEFF